MLWSTKADTSLLMRVRLGLEMGEGPYVFSL